VARHPSLIRLGKQVFSPADDADADDADASNFKIAKLYGEMVANFKNPKTGENDGKFFCRWF